MQGVHIYAATALGRCRVASPMLGRLYPGTHFIGHEGAKKNLHPSDTQERTLAVQAVVNRLAF